MHHDDAHLRERGLTQENVFKGHILRVRVDAVVLPNGQMANRELVEHPGAVAVVPIDALGRVVLVRQYRYPIDAVTLELPAGKLDSPGEDLAAAIRRELREETGCRDCAELIYLGVMHPSPAISNEAIYMFAASGFTEGEPETDADEFVETVRMSLDAALEAVATGAITDAKTIMGLFWVKQFGLTTRQQPPVRGTYHDEESS